MSKKYQILIIDDEEAIREMLGFSLVKHGFSVVEAGDCAQAMAVLNTKNPDLILLDWMLPEQSGIEFAKKLRAEEKTANIPIIMLTAKAEESNKIRGLEEAKADDYVTKPFSPRELMARIKTVLRRIPQVTEELNVGLLRLDFDNRKVYKADAEIELTAKQFNLLYFFMQNKDKVYTRQQLVDALATAQSFIDERSVDRQIKRLRDALKSHDCEHYIKTIRGHGYKFTSKT